MVIIQIKHKNYNKITLWLALFLSVIGIISLLLTQSRGACIGFLAGLFCLFILKMYAMKDFSIKSKLSIKNICMFIVIMTALIGGGHRLINYQEATIMSVFYCGHRVIICGKIIK